MSATPTTPTTNLKTGRAGLRLTLVRDAFKDTCTLGKLYVDGVFFCDVLEDTDRKLEVGGQKIYGKTAIPRGTYPVIIDMSQRFGKLLPRLIGVPQFQGIRIHPGNTHADTEGCLLVGTRAGESVRNSRVTFQRLMQVLEDALDKGKTLEIEIK